MNHPPSTRRRFQQLLGLSVLTPMLPALAHGERHTDNAAPAAVIFEQKPWGIAGTARQVRRTIEIRMGDNMRFSPARLDIREGETVRLRAVNRGQLLHEIVIGTPDELQAHAELMKKHPTMQHDEPYMAHVPAGRRGDIVWTFNRVGDFQFACLIPGHFDMGMVGSIRVMPKA